MKRSCDQAHHDAIILDPARWAALAPAGVLEDEDDDGRPVRIELANCACGGTLARAVAP